MLYDHEFWLHVPGAELDEAVSVTIPLRVRKAFLEGVEAGSNGHDDAFNPYARADFHEAWSGGRSLGCKFQHIFVQTVRPGAVLVEGGPYS